MKLLKLIINLPVMLKWMLILLIKQLASLERSLANRDKTETTVASYTVHVSFSISSWLNVSSYSYIAS